MMALPEFDTRPLSERYPGKDFVALPRALWPRAAADLVAAKDRWGGFILRFQKARRDANGEVLRRGGLVGVLVQQERKAEPHRALVRREEIPVEMQTFLKELATTTARAWARESLRQAGGFNES